MFWIPDGTVLRWSGAENAGDNTEFKKEIKLKRMKFNRIKFCTGKRFKERESLYRGTSSHAVYLFLTKVLVMLHRGFPQFKWKWASLRGFLQSTDCVGGGISSCSTRAQCACSTRAQSPAARAADLGVELMLSTARGISCFDCCGCPVAWVVFEATLEAENLWSFARFSLVPLEWVVEGQEEG